MSSCLDLDNVCLFHLLDNKIVLNGEYFKYHKVKRVEVGGGGLPATLKSERLTHYTDCGPG